MKAISVFAWLVLFVMTATGINHEPRRYAATRLTGPPPEIDGLLDDPAWAQAVWDTGFVQYEPYNEREPSQETAFSIAFDDNSIYVAIRAYDTSPDSIVKRLTRRDQEDGDEVGICFDSFYDLRTGFTFGVSAGGTKFDWIFSDDGQNEDHTWDPNWWVKTSIDDLGWVAEMRIPLSQLRFDSNGEGVWGLQVFRFLHRHSELSFWSHIPKDAPGLIHRFGKLTGVDNIDPKSVFDISPYLVTSARIYPAVAGNPFLPGNDYKYKLGLDSKFGISNNFTVDMTVNPDFGQVEADPSEVNLSAFETFFQEKRPFFIEGKNITSFSLGIGDGGVGNDNLFYSRRIGRRPAGSIPLSENMYADIPQFTNIIGAAKLTGKTRQGLSVAILETLTAETRATTDLAGERDAGTVEPLTNFLVGRVQKDFNNGNAIFGGMLTAVNRRLDKNLKSQMHRSAYAGGLDYTQYFKNKTWFFNLNAAASQVAGEKEAVLRTQRSSARYFQQPVDGSMRLDSSLTALNGTGGRAQFGKIGDGHWNFLGAVLWKSPQFEINDIGYMREADKIFQVLWASYKKWEPKGIYREYRINITQFAQWDFYGVNTMKGFNVNGFIRYKNYWGNEAGVEYAHGIISKTLLRGGPAMAVPDQVSSWFWVGSDNRKKLILNLNIRLGLGLDNFQNSRSISPGLSYKASTNLNMSFQPSFSKRYDMLQYVRTENSSGANRYIFGSINQEVVSFSFRLNYTVLPDLSLQFWGQPFIAAGRFKDFKYISNHAAIKFSDRYSVYDAGQLSLDGDRYRVDENRDGTTDYSFAKPDFHVREFLSNLVIRWEYNPGSALYLVWSQNRALNTLNGEMDYFRDINSLFSEEASNTFLIKFTYRIGVH